MKLLKTFDNPIEAHLLKTKLESEGIHCVLIDENIVSLDPLYNIAVGGIKLMVPLESFVEAKNVVAEINHTPFTDSADNIIVCPQCESKNITYFRTFPGLKGFLSILSILFFMNYPIFFRYIYKCKDCKCEFDK